MDVGCFQLGAVTNEAAVNISVSHCMGIGVLFSWVNTEEWDVWLLW